MAFSQANKDSHWAPAQYEKFKRERMQPLLDLVGLCMTATPPSGSGVLNVFDLGCGTGETTKLLHSELLNKAAQASTEVSVVTRGIDSSNTMLEKATSLFEPGLSFSHGDISKFPEMTDGLETGEVNLLFSNAALHWVPDHPSLFKRLASSVAPDGQFAVQMPSMANAPTHTIAARLATQEPFVSHLGADYVPPFKSVLEPEEYARILHECGYGETNVRLQIYPHYLENRSGAVEWVKGSLLTEFRDKLPKDVYTDFERQYTAELNKVLKDEKPFYFPYRRVLIWGRRVLPRL